MFDKLYDQSIFKTYLSLSFYITKYFGKEIYFLGDGGDLTCSLSTEREQAINTQRATKNAQNY